MIWVEGEERDNDVMSGLYCEIKRRFVFCIVVNDNVLQKLRDTVVILYLLEPGTCIKKIA